MLPYAKSYRIICMILLREQCWGVSLCFLISVYCMYLYNFVAYVLLVYFISIRIELNQDKCNLLHHIRLYLHAIINPFKVQTHLILNQIWSNKNGCFLFDAVGLFHFLFTIYWRQTLFDDCYTYLSKMLRGFGMVVKKNSRLLVASGCHITYVQNA